MNESIDPFQAYLKAKEFGLDGACIIIDGELCIDSDGASSALGNCKSSVVDFIFIQAKTSDRFDYGNVSKFLDAVYGFFKGEMNHESEQIEDLRKAIN